MECFFTPLTNVVERIHIALVNIEIRVGGKLHGLMLSGTPFLDGSIELIEHISAAILS